MKRRVLIAEDNEQAREQLRRLLCQDPNYEVETVGDGQEALEALTRGPRFNFLITDLRMPQLDGMDLIEQVRKRQLPVTVIVTTGHGSIDEAVQAMRLGAYDFLTKPLNLDQLHFILERAARERTLQDEVLHLREQMAQQYSFQGLISRSPRMQAVFELIQQVGATTTTVLIEGETGTGKEQVARAIHQASRAQRTGEMVAVNCAALPEHLIESELFGHEKGSFTGAVGQRNGRFELANGGTIFLDEVGDLPQPMQVKLLRVLQERCFERVGGTERILVDVRVVGATNRSLARLVKRGRFREDLYYRLNVVRIELPPLRERLEDIPLLATWFAARYTRPGEGPRSFHPDTLELLMKHTWPGNVRELENVIERACITTRGSEIRPEDLAGDVVKLPGQGSSLTVDLKQPLPELLQRVTTELEKQYLIKALRKAQGNIGQCATICGLSRRSISAKLAEYGLDKTQFRGDEAT